MNNNRRNILKSVASGAALATFGAIAGRSDPAAAANAASPSLPATAREPGRKEQAVAAGASSTMILINGRFHTVDKSRPTATAVAIKDGKFLAVGDIEDVMRHRSADSQVIDLNGRTVIPGLNDSHIHLIRGGLNYNLEPVSYTHLTLPTKA